ncbi:MAG TPA: adenylate/guanylate cyclase domain-containing protein [Candidatus Limnocylindrales bacterium]|nr:adenylate/guanylate cyclase domain-containing protein [Candidatus Limnocylindrales bacterium]
MTEQPETRYARSGDVQIGYQVVGQGPFDLVLLDQWFSNVDALWDFPPLARFVERLSSFARVIVLDKRGTGISDPVPDGGKPTLEAWMDDVRAVMDGAGSERAAFVAGLGACYLALLFAATYPSRTSALVLVDGFARLTGTDDYFPELPRSLADVDVEPIRSAWGAGGFLRAMAPAAYRNPEVLRGFARYERLSASPATAFVVGSVLYESDVRHVLPAIRVPTLVVTHTESARTPVQLSRYLADQIPDARHLELPGSGNLMWAGDQGRLLDELEEFLTGARRAPEVDRVLATVLFTDIVGSTERAHELGDFRWKELLDRHYSLAREQLGRFRGRQVVTTGDGLLATFDGPARAIRCAQAISAAVLPLGLELRAGLHTGEIELAASDVRGIAVHIGARICALAGPREVLVSSTVKDLVVGSGIEFEDRGVHALKGVPGHWHLYAVRS